MTIDVVAQEAIRGLPFGTPLRDVDGDLWRVDYAVVDGFEQAALRLLGCEFDLVASIDRAAVVYGPFTLVPESVQCDSALAEAGTA